MGAIFCLGVTSALQRTIVFDRFNVNEVNRASGVYESPAGKSVNTAYALVTLGSEAITSGFNGGMTGERVEALLRESRVRSRFTPMRAPTRICSTLLDRTTGNVTELVEEAPEVTPEELQAFEATCFRLVREASALVISGTLPKFLPSGFYRPFADAARERKIPVLVDSRQEALLATLPALPQIVKMNVRELSMTCGTECRKGEAGILHGMGLLRKWGARNLLVTQGADAAYLMTGESVYRLTPPKLDKIVNTTGSGDSVSAGIMDRLLCGDGLLDAVIFGLACGAANAQTLLPAHFSLEKVRELTAYVDFSRL